MGRAKVAQERIGVFVRPPGRRWRPRDAGGLFFAAVLDLGAALFAFAEDAGLAADFVTGFLDLFHRLGGVAGEGNGKEALLRNGFLGMLADAVGAGFDALNGGLDLGEGLLLVGD